MTNLATPADVQARLGRALNATEDARVDALLTDASAAVRAYTDQQFTEVTDDEIFLHPQRAVVILPQRPVNDVTAVQDTDGNDYPFTWHTGDRLYLSASGADIRLDLNLTAGSVPSPVAVTYDHGYTVIPDDIVAVVCGVVLRSLGRTPLESGVMQQAIAGYSETIGPVGAAGPVGFLTEEKAVLDRYRRPSGRVLAGGW